MGMGPLLLVTAIQDEVDGFCVSNIDEAIELRQAGLSKRILILGVSGNRSCFSIKNTISSLTVAGLEWTKHSYPK